MPEEIIIPDDVRSCLSDSHNPLIFSILGLYVLSGKDIHLLLLTCNSVFQWYAPNFPFIIPEFPLTCMYVKINDLCQFSAFMILWMHDMYCMDVVSACNMSTVHCIHIYTSPQVSLKLHGIWECTKNEETSGVNTELQPISICWISAFPWCLIHTYIRSLSVICAIFLCFDDSAKAAWYPLCSICAPYTLYYKLVHYVFSKLFATINYSCLEFEVC